MTFQDMGTTYMDALHIKAVLFDMDGLLLDTESLAMLGLEQAATEMGISAPESFHHAMIGVPADHCRVLIEERFGRSFPAEDYLTAASRHMNALIEAGALRLKPGVRCLLSHLEALGIPKAVATSSSRAKAERHLRHTGILGRFDAVVTRDDVARGKPHPDLFLQAAERLGMEAGQCLALEDSYNGVRAAHAAGAPVIMVPDLLPPTNEMREKCALVATDLHAVRPLIFPPPPWASTVPITLQGPTTTWSRVFPVTGAPLVGAPLADPATMMNEALERAERWAEVAYFQTNHSAGASAAVPTQSSRRPNWYRW